MSDSKGNKNIKRFDLERLEKKNIYQVPDRYFDELPAIIQSRVVKKPPFYKTNVVRVGFRYAFPVACLLVIGIYFGFFANQSQQSKSFEALISEVSHDDLAAYLENSDISTEEIIASIENEDYFIEFEETEIVPLQDFDLENENIDELLQELGTDGVYF